MVGTLLVWLTQKHLSNSNIVINIIDEFARQNRSFRHISHLESQKSKSTTQKTKVEIQKLLLPGQTFSMPVCTVKFKIPQE
jgi:hypothetical protein